MWSKRRVTFLGLRPLLRPRQTQLCSTAGGVEAPEDAAEVVTKIYIGAPLSVAAAPGHPVLIYRKYTGKDGRPGFKSVITSYCMATDVARIKRDGRELESREEYRLRVKNKSVFGDAEIDAWYRDSRNLMVIEMVYLGYFGLGHNVNWRWLKENGYWPDRFPMRSSLAQTVATRRSTASSSIRASATRPSPTTSRSPISSPSCSIRRSPQAPTCARRAGSRTFVAWRLFC